MNKHACSSSFNNENIIRLIQLYEFHRVLWDSTLTDYRNNDLRQDAWKAISNELNIPIGELKKKMTTLLATNRKERSNNFFIHHLGFRLFLFFYLKCVE
ncbi:hypothetical protein PYW08_004977 [Mythimna loreyi]|uniref:Uncharacterized protein n=1 Tax=Mythimna loreyi TaxID=667449 RepID=A0ACC2QFQ1_9NEOP|nr:hypothetical protein PYW08_004977 [Mythimna loreyi]